MYLYHDAKNAAICAFWRPLVNNEAQRATARGLHSFVIVPTGHVHVHALRMAKSRRESKMPVCFIEAPPGIRAEAKKRMVEKITQAIDEAYHIGDTLIFLREYSAENVAMDGRLQSENPKILEALKKISAA